MGYKSTKPLFFGGVNRHFQAKLLKYQHLHTPVLSNYCINSNEILHSDKDHQILFIGCPNMLITNPRWRTVAILENIEKLSYLTNGLTECHEVLHILQFQF